MLKSDLSYLNLLVLIRNAYISDNKEKWNSLITQANELISDKNKFSEIIHPHFYSGKLFDPATNQLIPPKYLFLTMNPMLRSNLNIEHYNRFSTYSLKEFLTYQNNIFNTFKEYSSIYKKCQNVLGSIKNIPLDSIKRYDLLHQNAVALDWFPFFNPSFSLRSDVTSFALNLFNPILKILDIKPITGISISSAMRELLKDNESLLGLKNITKYYLDIQDKFKILKYKNISIYRINQSKLFVIPALATRTEPPPDIYNEIKELITHYQNI